MKSESDKREWCIEETAYHPAQENIGGTLFCSGNGYMGLRGSYEELGTKVAQGLYVRGVFREMTEHMFFTADTFCRKKYIFNEELMNMPLAFQKQQNLPDPLLIKIFIDGVPFRMWDGKLLEYRRTLDLRTGVLCRTVRWDNGEGKISTIDICRFCSMANRHLIVQQYCITPENWSGSVGLESGIDAGLNSEYAEEVRWHADAGMLVDVNIPGLGARVCQAVEQHLLVDGSSFESEWGQTEKLRRYKNETEIGLQQGQMLTLEKFCAVCASVDEDAESPLEECTSDIAKKEAQKGFQCCAAENEEAWRQLWQQADIRIDGDPEAQRFLRFGLFHLLIASPREDSITSIAAKALTGDGYHGHVFWDMDINLAPFYQWVFPVWAKGHCQYRYRLLDAARAIARQEGRSGARYPWSSAVSGKEEAPISIICSRTQIHVVPDIAYAVFRYAEISGDQQWWQEEGLEIITECARYMAERVVFNEQYDRYEILDVGGPDEYHPVTDNNAYTNYLTTWLFRCGVESWQEGFDKLKTQLKLSNEELVRWQEMADKMYCPADPVTGLIPQCDGFFDLKETWEKSGSDWGGPGAEYHECKGIKQPDVILLLTLLPQLFGPKHLASNWDYYERFILHGSSLSPSIHALVAAKMGLAHKAKHYFNLSARFDFDDYNHDTCQGVHIGNFGGLWQAMVYGFAGMELRGETLCFSPVLPEEWKGLSFRIVFRGNAFSIYLAKDHVRITADAGNPQDIEFSVFGRTGPVNAGEEKQFNWSE